MSSKKTRTVQKSLGIREYLQESRDLFTSILLVIPLFVFYQVGVLATGGLRNGVDFVTDMMWLIARDDMLIYLAINGGILLAFVAGAFFLRHRGTFRPKLWPFMIAESTVYALLLGGTVGWVMSTLGLDALLQVGEEGYGAFTSLVLSIGAGLYEEIVFRLVLMGGLFLAGVRLLKLPDWLSAVGAVILSSLVFSAIHYVGPLGDAFTLGSFFFRFFAGAILAAIFYLRGFAVAVYTHAIYDVIVMIFH